MQALPLLRATLHMSVTRELWSQAKCRRVRRTRFQSMANNDVDQLCKVSHHACSFEPLERGVGTNQPTLVSSSRSLGNKDAKESHSVVSHQS